MSTAKAGARDFRSLQVEPIQSWNELSALRDEWDPLLAASDSASTFLSLPWIESWLETFGRTAAPLVLPCRSETGELRGIAPLFILPLSPFRLVRVVRFLGDIRGESDNLDLIAERGYEDLVADAVLGALERMRHRWDVLELRHIQQESPVLNHFRAGAEQRGWVIDERNSPHLIVDLTPSWQAVLARMTTDGRRAATYTDRHVARAGAPVSRHCERREALPYFLDALMSLHAKRWAMRGQRGHFRTPERRRFYEGIAERFLECGRLDLDLLEVDGRPIAAQLGIRRAKSYCLLESGFDPAHARLKPGTGLMGHVMKRLIADGIEQYDFLEGDEAYRLRWSPRVSHYVHLRIVRPRSRGARHLAMTRASAGWRHAARARFPALFELVRRARDRTKGS